MPIAEYLVVTSAAFQLPAHPRPTPVYPASANAAIHQETVCTYDAIQKELNTATTFKEEMKNKSWKQLTAYIWPLLMMIHLGLLKSPSLT